MQRTLIALVALVVLLGSAAPPAAAGERERVATGRGVIDPADALPFAFEFKARGTPQRATGRATFQTILIDPIVGDVNCLAVKGKRAAISGKLRRSTPNGRYFLLVVKDNGPAQDPPTDTLFVEATPELVRCEQALDKTGEPIREGYIRVR